MHIGYIHRASCELLRAASLTGASVSGLTSVLTKKYQNKLSKVTTLIDIIMSVLAVFERVASKALRDAKIDEEEFNSLYTLYHEPVNELSDIDRKMEAENRNQNALLKKITMKRPI